MFQTLVLLALGALAAPVAPAVDDGGPRSPEAFHGYELGTTYTITGNLYEYYRALARDSPRVEYLEYGRTIQGRPLPMLFISSEKNLASKDRTRERIRRLTQVIEPLSESEIAELVADIPVIVWIFIVDTDEEAGVEVLQEVAYDLATREDAEARATRDNVLVVMTPLTNPDSHARYVTWHKLYDVEGASLDPNAIENRAHWGMNTDGNAHGIDVNRDFGWFVSPEMQAFAREAMRWRPQLLLDIHSGPNVIFLPPFPPPYHPLWSEAAPDWWHRVAERSSDAFGRRGWTFNSREGYEGVASVGFGLSWGMLGPSVSAFLYETFGGRPGKTTSFLRSDGTVATMRMAMDRHEVGTWSLLEVARENRERLLRDAHRVVVQGVQEARAAPFRTVVIPAEGEGVDPTKVSRLVERLSLQEVAVERLEQPQSLDVQNMFELSASERRSFPAGSYVIDFVQPQARLARALLDPSLDYSNPEVLVPYNRKMPFYDTTWGVMPFLFGVTAYVSPDAVTAARAPVEETGRAEGELAGLSRVEPPYAYLLPSGREASYRVAIELLQEGYRLRVFHRSLQIGDAHYPKGTWAAIRSRNPETLDARLEALVKERGAHAIAVASPFTDAGATFGDDRQLAAIPKPAVAVVADWPVTQDHTFGGIRSVLEADFGFSFSPVLVETLNRADLSKYTAVVLPHAGMDIRGGPGFNRGYRGRLDTENLRHYVEGGGTLIAVQGAADMIAEDEVLGAGVTFDGWAEHTNGPALRARWTMGLDAASDTMAWRPGLDRVGVPLLAAGYTGETFAAPGAYPVLFSVEEEGRAEVVARYEDDPDRVMLDGFMLDSDREKLAGKPFVIVSPVGRGRVIYFACDPTFRGYWYGLNLLFLNSLVLGPTL